MLRFGVIFGTKLGGVLLFRMTFILVRPLGPWYFPAAGLAGAAAAAAVAAAAIAAAAPFGRLSADFLFCF